MSKRKAHPKSKSEESQLQELLFGIQSKQKGKGKEGGGGEQKRKKSSRSNESEIELEINVNNKTKQVWKDEDDDEVEVDLNATDRLRKLIPTTSTTSNQQGLGKVSNKEFSELLQERFQTKELGWASTIAIESSKDTNKGESKKIGRNLSTLLQSSGSLVATKKSPSFAKPQFLQEGKINIARLIDANISEPSRDSISTVKFHPSQGNLLMVGGNDKTLRFFNVDGEKNEKQLSVKFNDMAITSASFLNSSNSSSSSSSEVIVVGRKPYYYSYDTISGAVSKIAGHRGGRGSGVAGGDLMKSHEIMAVAPDGSKIAFAGAGGYVHVSCGRLKTWMIDVKMNTGVRALSFVDENTLMTSGVDADVYVWDLRYTGKCLWRFGHDDGTCTSALGVCPSSSSFSTSRFFAIGAESGVVSVFKESILEQQVMMSKPPTAVKSIMSLTTKVDSISFHPSGQVMAIASDQKTDQLRLIHLPSCTTFKNWPTDRTPMRKVKAMDFSPGGGYFAVGNNKGKVLLYRLNHFGAI